MAESRAASRYAKALLDLAIEKGLVEQVHTDMQFFAQTCEENRSLITLFDSPIIPHHKKMAVLTDIFKSRVNPVSFSIFEIITRKNREEILYSVAKEFHNLYNQYQGIQTAQVTTTFPLDESLRNQFKEMVRKVSGKQPELNEKVDASMIGGFVLNIGDKQIDESVKGKLRSLQRKLAK